MAWQTYPFPKYMDFDSLHAHGFHGTSKYASVTRVARTWCSQSHGNFWPPLLFIRPKDLIRWFCTKNYFKTDGFLLPNFFILCQTCQKINVVLTDHCQMSGLPLTLHVTWAKKWNFQVLGWTEIWDVKSDGNQSWIFWKLIHKMKMLCKKIHLSKEQLNLI